MHKIISGLLAVSAAVSALPVAAQDYGDRGRDGYYSRDYRHDDRSERRDYRDYRHDDRRDYRDARRDDRADYARYYDSADYARYDDRAGYYSGPRWRGGDGRDYCRRSDGTTGLIVGGVAGALVGSSLAGRGDRGAGTLLGGVLGALAGRAVDRDNVRCR